MLLFSIIGIWYFVKRKTNYEVDFSYWGLDKRMLKPILSVGVSAMMLQIMFVIQQVFVFRSIVHYGSDDPNEVYNANYHVAVIGANYRIMILMLMPIFGFSQAMAPVVGINYGAKVYDRVKSSFSIFTKASTISLIFLWILEMLYPEVILGWMLPDAVLRSQDILNFRIQMATYPVFPFFFMGTTLFQSIGNAKLAGYMLVARELALFVPLVLLLPYTLSLIHISEPTRPY